jgi:prepilin-type N-terminal cleavage/methylation domain-containing protein
MRHPSRQRGRTGFTLVELIVVIAIIAALAALAILFFPSFRASAREAKGAGDLQGWLINARQRARRDGVPTGLRFWLQDFNKFSNPATIWLYATDCEYIQVPDDYGPAGFMVFADTTADPSGRTVVLQTTAGGPNISRGYPGKEYWDIQQGDYFEVDNNGLTHLVLDVTINYQLDPLKSAVFLNSPIANTPANPTRIYNDQRKPRVVDGEQPLKLPEGIVVDFWINTDPAVPPLNQNPVKIEFDKPPSDPTRLPSYVDVLFAPSGAVISAGQTQTTVNFWVRNQQFNGSIDPQFVDWDPFAGEPSIIAVSTRTGFVGAYQPFAAASPPNPYFLVKQ